MIAMPVQHYIKHAFEDEDASISDIARRTGVCWRTAASLCTPWPPNYAVPTCQTESPWWQCELLLGRIEAVARAPQTRVIE